MDSLTLNNLTVDSQGHVSFAGLTSGIDFKKAVDDIIAARRIPVDTLQTRVSANQDRIKAYADLRTLLTNLENSLSQLRGAVSVGNAADVFKAKQSTLTASRSDGGAASAAANLVGVNVSNAAVAGVHTLEVVRTAAAHKIASGAFTSLTDNLGVARGGASGSIAGSFTINGVAIDVLATDSLQDLRDRINNANTGSNATHVSASIVSVAANQSFLVLTADQTGTPISIGNEVGGVLAQLGISADGGSTFLNELQAPQTALLHADGLLDPAKFASKSVASATATLDSFAGVTGGPHTFDIRDANGAVIKTVTYSGSDTLQTLASAITDAGAGLAASVVADGSSFRLEITKTDNAPITLGNDSANLLTSLDIKRQPLVIERTSNTISDLFGGVTVSLFQAEPGTTIRIDVDRDLNAVKSAVTGFVQAYNAVKAFVNGQDLTDPTNGGKASGAGPLFGSRTLGEIAAKLGRILGAGTPVVSGDFSVLSQIGVRFVDNGTVADPTERNTLVVDEAALDQALLNHPDDVRRLFAFDMSSSDPRITLLGFTGKTSFSGTGYTLNLTHDGISLTGADIDGIAGSATVNGNTINVTDATGAAGLTLLYSGDTSASGIQINLTPGVGAQLFFAIDDMLDPSQGQVQAEIDSLTDQNTAAQERIDRMLQRLDYQRQQLTNRFIAMESALATMSSLLDSIKQTTEAMFAKRG